MCKACQLYPCVYPDDTNPDTFKAGTWWFKIFKDRHGIRALSLQGESLLAAAKIVNPFKASLKKLMEERFLMLSQVFNFRDRTVYDTGLYLETHAIQDTRIIM
jgi:hypothetical protein